MTLEHPIMVSGNDNLVSMGLFAQPLIEINNLARSIAERHEIAGMNQHVPIRHAQFGVLAVCIADAYNANPRHIVPSICGRFEAPALI
jgi:hypothetical protein